jgi:hypothetical protein
MSFSSQASPVPALDQLYNSANLYKQGGTITVTPTSVLLTISPLICRDGSNGFDINVGNYYGQTYQDPFGTVITVAPVNTTVNGAVNGLNGLDTGTIAASTVYAVWAISDPSNYNPSGFLLSLSQTAPYMPSGQSSSGYSAMRRIGWAITNSSSQFEVFLQSGLGSVVTYSSNVPIAAVTAGVATSQTAITLTTEVPAINGMVVLLGASFTPATAGDTLKVCYSGGAIATSQNKITGQVAAVPITQQMQVPLALISGVPKIDYILSAAGATTIYVNGFVDLL